MTAEDAFQAVLDLDLDDHHCRCVFADWLEDHDDPRAAGYRALGLLGIHPFYRDPYWFLWNRDEQPCKTNVRSMLPRAWFLAIRGILYKSGNCWEVRRAAEDAAATAFSELSSEQQAEILSRVEVLV